MLTLLLTGVFGPLGQAPAQTPPSESGSESRSDKPLAVDDSGLRIIYVRDENGKLYPVSDLPFPLERLNQLRRYYEGLEPAPPRQTLEKLTVNAAVEEAAATVSGVLEAQSQADGWIRLPLGMPQAVLRETRIRPAVETVLSFQADEGYVLWFQARRETAYRIELTGAVPLTTPGAAAGQDQAQLAVTLPRAKQSVMTVTTPATGLQVESTPSSGLQVEQEAGQTKMTISPARGRISLRWQRERGARRRILQAISNVTATFDGQSSLRWDARIRVRSSGPPIESFLVKLPPEAELSAATETGVRFEAVQRPDGAYAKVTLAEPSRAPDEIRLAALAALGRLGDWKLQGFTVPEAARQSGHLALVVEGDWQLTVGETRHVVRTDRTPEALDGPGRRAAYELFHAGYQIGASIAPKQTNIGVEPLYILRVGGRRAELEARFACRIRGARAFQLPVSLKGWTIDRIEPDMIVDPNETDVSQVEPLELRFRKGQIGPITLVVRAHQEIPADAEDVAFPLPEPHVSSLAPATVVVAANRDIQLTPRPERIRGLSLTASPPPDEVARDGEDALVYLLRDGGQAEWVGGIQRYQRTVTGRSAFAIHLGDGRVEVVQQIRCQIEHEPIAALELAMPAEFSDQIEGSLAATIDDAAVELALDRETGRWRLPLPATRRLGPVEATLTYRLALPRPDAETRATVAVPLPTLPQVVDEEQSVRWTAAEPLAAELAGEAWEGWESNGPGREVLRSGPPAGRLVLEIGDRLESSAPRGTRIRKAWVQTRLSGSQRQDRIVWLLETSASRLEIGLPEAVDGESLHLRVDGQRNELTRPAGDRLTFAVPEDLPGGRVRVELWLRRPAPTTWFGAIPVAMPRIEEAGAPNAFYWELLTDEAMTICSHSTRLTPQPGWQWNLFQSPPSDGVGLSKWMGVEPTDEFVPLPPRRLVLASLGDPEGASVVLASHRWILLAAAVFVFLTGLLLATWSWLRSPIVLAAMALVLLAATAQAPTLSELLAEGALLGLGALAISRLLTWLFLLEPPAEIPLERPASTPSRPAASATPGVEEPAHATTATAAAPLAAPVLRETS